MAGPVHVLDRGAPPPDLTLRYGQLEEHVVDVRLPAHLGNGPRPAAVIIHGGFWRPAYDRTHAGPQSVALAEAGYVVATVEYRRAGSSENSWVTTFDDVASVCDQLPSLLAASVGSNVRLATTVLVGHSAGGHLALWSAGRHRLPPTSRWHRTTPLPVSHVVSLAGIVDLVRADELRLGSGAAAALLGGGARTVPERYAVTNPAALLPLGVRTVLLHGSADQQVPVELSRNYAARAAAAGEAVTFTELPGVGHYELIDPLSPVWDRVLDAMAERS